MYFIFIFLLQNLIPFLRGIGCYVMGCVQFCHDGRVGCVHRGFARNGFFFFWGGDPQKNDALDVGRGLFLIIKKNKKKLVGA